MFPTFVITLQKYVENYIKIKFKMMMMLLIMTVMMFTMVTNYHENYVDSDNNSIVARVDKSLYIDDAKTFFLRVDYVFFFVLN